MTLLCFPKVEVILTKIILAYNDEPAIKNKFIETPAMQIFTSIYFLAIKTMTSPLLLCISMFAYLGNFQEKDLEEPEIRSQGVSEQGGTAK